MGAVDIDGIFQVGVDIVNSTVSEKTKRVLFHTGSVTGETPDADNVEHWQTCGFVSRPPKPQAGKQACQAITIRQGGHDVSICTQDARGLALAGALDHGEFCAYAPGVDGNGQGRIIGKKDGSVTMFSTKGNVEGGASMMVQIDAMNGAIRLLNDLGHGIVIDADGVKIFTNGAAALTLTTAGSASLVATSGQCQIDGPGICIGSLALPGLNSALTGVTGIAGKASLKTLIE